MNTASLRARKTSLAIAATLALGGSPTQDAWALSCIWNPATGNWSTGSDWSCAAAPGAADSASIASGKVVTINTAQSVNTLSNAGGVNIDAFLLTLGGAGSSTNSGVINVGGASTGALNVSAGHNINNTGGGINIANGSVLNQFGSSLKGGTVSSSGTGALVVFNSNSNFLDGVTLNSRLDMSATSIERVINNLVLNRTVALGGSSVLSFEGDQTLSGTGQILFAAGGNNRVAVDGGNKTLTIGAGMLIRGADGSIGDALFVNGNGNKVINQGTINSDLGGSIVIRSLTAGLDNQNVLSATGAGSVLRFDNNINNTGGQIQASAGGVVLQNGVTVAGGSISTSLGGSYRMSANGANLLSGVTLTSGSNIDMSAISLGRVQNGMVLNGSINIDNSSYLGFENDQTLSGSGSVVFGATGNNRLGVDGGNKTLTIGSGVTVRGENGSVGDAVFINGNGNALINNGLISADVAGGVITLRNLTSGITNNGTLEAKNGGTLVLSSNVTGGVGSQISAGAGSVVLQNGVTLSGAINTAGTGNFRPTASAVNFLSGVTFAGTLDMASAVSLEQVVGGLTNNGTIKLDNSSYLGFNNTQTLSGSGSIVFGATGNNRVGVDGGNQTLTIASGMVIRGENGAIGDGAFINGNGNALVNNGLISADVAGGVITLRNLTSGITNNGTLEAKNGGTLVLSSNVNAGTGLIAAGVGSTVLQAGVTVSGALNLSGVGTFRPTASVSNFLSGVTLNGTLDMASSLAIERVVGGLTLNGAVNVGNSSYLSFEGDQTLNGSGQIVFGAGGSNRVGVDGGNKTLTLASGVTIRGIDGSVGDSAFVSGNGNKLINQGLISSDSGGTITIRSLAAGLENQSILRATGAGSALVLSNNIDNSAGQLQATSGGVILQNGVLVSGGNINTSSGGAYRMTAAATNYLSGVTLSSGSTIDMSAFSLGRVLNGMAINGTVNLGGSSVLSFENNQTLTGAGQIVFGAGGSNRLGVDGGNQTLTIASGMTVRGVDGSIGDGLFVSGVGNALVNNGVINSDGGGTLTLRGLNGGVSNNGTLRAQNGTLTLQSQPLVGTGTLQVDATGVLNLAGANTQGRLLMGGAGATLNIGTQNLTITNDYTNVGAGSGNSFDKRAGIAGAGLVVAGGDAAQTITGANVSNGNTNSATLTIGNVRVGANTFNYQVANTGSTGPMLRGAVQTNVNGATLNDARLSGAGVVAGNYNTGAPGSNTGDQAVVFTAASAGLLAPLVNQRLNLTSNFSNIADQKLNLVLGAGAAAFNVAAGAATPSPVTVANQRVGGSNTAALTVTNTAVAGAFSEDLNASFGANSGAASSAGAVNGLLAGANSSAMAVGVNTATAGAKSGTVTLNYQTAGAVNGVSNGLGVASVGSQVITVNGNVYQAASGAIQTAALNFGTLQVGQTFDQALVIRNTATGAAGFVEDLRASFGSSAGTGASQISGIGALTGITAGNNSNAGNGAMTVRITGLVAGAINGTMGVNYQTAGAVGGVSNGLGVAGAGSENYGVQGSIEAFANVINQANPLLNTPLINFGAVRVGAAPLTSQVSVSNLASAPPQAALTASSIVASGAPFTASGSFALLAPGATNSSSLMVGMNTATAGNFTGGNAGTATISFVSDASNVGGCAPNCEMALGTQNLGLVGKVYSAATGQLLNSIVNFGVVRVGDVVAARDINVSNTGPASALSDTLRANLSGVGGPFTAAGSAVGIAAQGAGAMSVGLNTASAGVYSQFGNVAFLSQNADMADIAAGADAAVQVQAQINNLANADFDKLAGLGVLTQNGNDYVLDFGDVSLGSLLTALLQMDNEVVGPADELSGNFDQSAVNDFSLSGWAAFSLLGAGQAQGGLNVGFMASTLGLFTDEVLFNGLGTNASDINGLAQQRRLLIRANVIDPDGHDLPESGSLALVLAGALAGVIARRRAVRAHAAH